MVVRKLVMNLTNQVVHSGTTLVGNLHNCISADYQTLDPKLLNCVVLLDVNNFRIFLILLLFACLFVLAFCFTFRCLSNSFNNQSN